MSLGNKVFSGMIWSAIERIAIQIVQFGLGLILARILTPSEYGVFAILLVFIVISKVFVDSGFTKALIQKKDRTEDDISTVFIFNLAISLFVYLILWIVAPYVSLFYKIPELTLLLRILALSLITNALFAVIATLFTIKLDFRTLTKINFSATVLSGGLAIYMAYNGYGVWALVFQTLVRSSITAILMWSLTKWKPSWVFSKISFKELFSFGSKLLVSSLLGSTFSQINSILIGKYIGAKDLGYYTRGIQFSDAVFGVFSSSLNSVLLPSLAPIQNQKNLLVKYTRTIIKTSALVTAPVFIGLAVMAKPIILVLLTEKWLLAVPIMQIFCIARFITVISGININLLYTIGRTDLTLKQQYVNIAVRVSLLLLALKHGILYIALAELISTFIHFFINTYFPGKIMNYGALKQIKDILPISLISLAMGGFVYVMMRFIDNDILEVCILPILGLLFYWGIIYSLKIPEYQFVMNKTKEILKK